MDHRETDFFDTVQNWIFDLDNTLYPSHTNLFAQIDMKMGSFLADFFNIDLASARTIQKDYYYRYGTTLSGLMIEHNLPPKQFLDYVHDIDYSPVEENTALKFAIEALPGKKFIFTNGSVSHAVAVADRLGITQIFDDIFDIEAAGFTPKPHEPAFESFLKKNPVKPEKSAMFEDLHHNLKVPHTLGMKTVLVHSDYQDHPKQKEQKSWAKLPEYIDQKADDLTSFLQGLINDKNLNLERP